MCSSDLMDLGRAVWTDRLVDAIWGDELPDDPIAALHTLVSRLRASLPARVGIVSLAGAYRLDAGPGTIDIADVDHWACTQGDLPAESRRDAARSARALFRGIPFVELDGVDVLAARDHYEQLRWATIEAEAEALLALGEPNAAAEVLRPLLLEAPGRESTAALTMRALYGAGRQADALAVFAALRGHLREEFGLEPTPALIELERSILTHEVLADPRAPEPVSVTRRPLSSFLGREADLDALVGLVRDVRLLTIVGPGEIGRAHV